MPTTRTDRIRALRTALPQGVRLVAVSKFHPAEVIREAYLSGQRVFGESYVQELLSKQAALPRDIEWHFIGHLQRNKVRQIAAFIAMIESVDSPRLLCEIQRQAAHHKRVIDVLLEIHVAAETTKTGFSLAACEAFLETFNKDDYPNVRLCGLMTMATNTDDAAQIEREFQLAAAFFDHIKARFFPHDDAFCERSWGMSDDYPIALRHHATLVRLGTLLFGARQ